MGTETFALSMIFDRWQGYQVSLVKAVEPLTREQLAYQSAAGLRSVGQIVNYIACGRADWLFKNWRGQHRAAQAGRGVG